MPSLSHEGLVLLFRNAPALAPQLARDLLHAPIPTFAALEAFRASGRFEYQSDFALKHRGEGRAEGRTEGRAQAIVVVLETRGLPVGDAERARILGCTDVALLDRWIRRAVTAASVDELFRD